MGTHHNHITTFEAPQFRDGMSLFRHDEAIKEPDVPEEVTVAQAPVTAS